MNQRPPVARFVFVGASNLRLISATLVAAARNAFDGPVDLYIASGFGRSYGERSSIPFRTLPGILQCGLWSALQEQPTLPTFAFVTDVGNDLVYGRKPQRVIEWVEQCVERLNANGAQTLITSLPIASTEAIGPLRYKIFRRIFFPECDLPLATLLERAQQVNHQLIQLAEHHRCPVIDLPNHWYGMDPIHYKRRYYRELSEQLLNAWGIRGEIQKSLYLSIKKRIQFERSKSERRWVLGQERICKQPTMIFKEGSRVHLY